MIRFRIFSIHCVQFSIVWCHEIICDEVCIHICISNNTLNLFDFFVVRLQQRKIKSLPTHAEFHHFFFILLFVCSSFFFFFNSFDGIIMRAGVIIIIFKVPKRFIAAMRRRGEKIDINSIGCIRTDHKHAESVQSKQNEKKN